jgi:broad-specificity NMP kinase
VESHTAHVIKSVDAVILLGTSETPKLLFGPLKQNTSGSRFHNNKEVEMALNKWFRLQELKPTHVEF